MATYRKRIPYGMMNFVDVRMDDCYYVDKTRFIPVIEQANRYAASENVQRSVGTTQLHKIVVVYRGMDMEVCEEVC